MNKLEAKRRMQAAFDDIAKGAVTLIVTAIITRLVDDTYDKFVIGRRYDHLKDDPDAQA